MKVHIFYKHETETRVEYNLYRAYPDDPAYLSFTPESGEDYPFPNEPNPVSLERVLEMAMEYAQMDEALQVMGIETEVVTDETE